MTGGPLCPARGPATPVENLPGPGDRFPARAMYGDFRPARPGHWQPPPGDVSSTRCRVHIDPVIPTEPAGVVLPARSRRQAMDWSLVLASQGIEVTIDHQPDGLGWVLIVAPAQAAAAQANIRQYQRENRGWALRRRLRDLGFRFHGGALAWAGGLLALHALSAATGEGLELAGCMTHTVTATGEWWRLVTATMLHADVGHLAANVATGLVTLGLAMGRYGAGWALGTTLLAGALGNLAGLFLHPGPYRGLGASGMVMGALGLLTVQSLGVWRSPRAAWRSVLAGVAAGALLFVLLGLNPRSDVVAHAGGYAGGLLGGLLLNGLPARLGPRTAADRAAGAAAGLLALVCWLEALAGR